MARRKRGEETLPTIHEENGMNLKPGFYICDEHGSVKTTTKTFGKPGTPERRTEEVPISFRTIASARDALSLCDTSCGILCVTPDNFHWKC